MTLVVQDTQPWTAFSRVATNGNTWSDFDQIDGASLTIVTDQTGPKSPGSDLRYRSPVGMAGGGAPGSVALSFNPNTKQYWQIISWMKVSAAFNGHSSGENKYYLVKSDSGNNAARVIVEIHGAGSDPLYPSFEIQDNDGGPGVGFHVGSVAITRNVYFGIKAQVYHGTPGNADAVLKMWVNLLDGAGWRAAVNDTGVQILPGSSTNGNTTAALFTQIWGGTTGALAAEQSVYVDEDYLQVADGFGEFTDPYGASTAAAAAARHHRRMMAT